MRRDRVLAWFDRGLDAVDARRLVANRLSGREPCGMIAIGKAARSMAWGAADAWGAVSGVCVCDSAGEVPAGVELLVGDHPVPGPASFAAGRRVMEVAAEPGPVILLLSGGGSALCEHPLPHVPEEFVAMATRRLLAAGASIGDTNLVRSHLSALKAGGLARAAGGDILTLALSDVGPLGPETIASGPTLSPGRDPESALRVMRAHGIVVPAGVEEAVRSVATEPVESPFEVLADGRDAAGALVEAARADGVEARLHDGWLDGPVPDALLRFLSFADTGVTVWAGESTLEVAGDGRGGRNTHAALLGAVRIAGEDALFAALATDGVDGSSGAAGAIVDGTTVERGGDPTPALAAFDSATYLEAAGDLVVTGRTGTNVADLWVLWRW